MRLNGFLRSSIAGTYRHHVCYGVLFFEVDNSEFVALDQSRDVKGPGWGALCSGGSDNARIEWGIDDLTDLCAGAPCVPIPFLRFAARFGEFHLRIHVDHCHHFARIREGVGPGSMEKVAKMEAHFAGFVWRLVDFAVREFHGFGNAFFAFIADCEMAIIENSVASPGERQRAVPKGNGVERHPCGDSQFAGKRPVNLIDVPRGITAAGFLVESLIVIEAHAVGAQQIACNAGESHGEHELFNPLAVRPEVYDLKKRFAVGVAVFKWRLVVVKRLDEAGDFIAVMLQGVGGENIFKLDEAVFSELRDLLLGKWEGPINLLRFANCGWLKRRKGWCVHTTKRLALAGMMRLLVGCKYLY